MPRNSNTLVISVAHPVDPDFVVGWDEFLSNFENYLGDDTPLITFTVNFIGARQGHRRVRIDALIRRMLVSLGITRSECMPGSFTAKNARQM